MSTKILCLRFFEVTKLSTFLKITKLSTLENQIASLIFSKTSNAKYSLTKFIMICFII